MTLQGPQTPSLAYTPYPGNRVVRSRDAKITVYLKTAHASLMADEDMLAEALFDIPDPQSSITRAGYCRCAVRHLQAPHRGCVATEYVKRFAGDQC